MKLALILLLIVPLHGQQQTVNNEPFPSARTKINANFTDLYTNKAGNSACSANQYAIQTTTAGVVCASLTSGQLVTALGFTPVSSVAGRTGAVVLGESDVTGLASDLSARPTTAAGVIALWTTCTGYLKSTGTCDAGPTTVSGSAGSLAAQYIDWNAGSGGASIANKPTIGTAASHPATDFAVSNASTTVNGQSCALGSTCTVTADPTSAQFKIRTCEVIVGDPGAASSALADDNDSPASCGNKTGATLTITAVECYANAGTPTVTPIITGGGATSILTGALTCGTGSFASGTLNGTPTQSNGGSIDANITTAGGTAKYIVIRITRTL